MGGTASTDQEHPTHGWRILQVVPNSPSADKGLVVYFDFIIGCNGIRVDAADNDIFPRGVANSAGKDLILTVYNFKTQNSREVTIIPRNDWGGDGYLGMVIVFDSFMRADEDCIHVEKVHPNSPASRAGLIPNEDYFLGTPELIFKGYDELDYIVNRRMRQPVDIFVFNAKSNSVRLATIIPDNEWEGDGSLGCDVSHGFLHRLPASTEPVHMSAIKTSVSSQPHLPKPVETSSSGAEQPAAAAPVDVVTSSQQQQPQQQQQQHPTAPVTDELPNPPTEPYVDPAGPVPAVVPAESHDIYTRQQQQQQQVEQTQQQHSANTEMLEEVHLSSDTELKSTENLDPFPQQPHLEAQTAADSQEVHHEEAAAAAVSEEINPSAAQHVQSSDQRETVLDNLHVAKEHVIAEFEEATLP